MLGIFGGTFNPIHFGHLALAEAVQQALQLSKVHFVPSATPPHKSLPQVTATQRADMVALAIADYPQFVLNRAELLREGPSYTVDTLLQLQGQYPQQALCLIMGLDSYLQLPHWHAWQDLLSLAHLAVVHRADYNPAFVPHTAHQSAYLPLLAAKSAMATRTAGILTYVGYTPPDISSSECRLALASGEGYLSKIPVKVLNYIRINQLYRTKS